MNRIVRSRSAPPPTPSRAGVTMHSRIVRGGLKRDATDSPPPGASSKQIGFKDTDTGLSTGALSSRVPIKPVIDPITLNTIISYSTVIGPCIEAYVTNLALYGWEIVLADGLPTDTEMDPDEVAMLSSFVQSPNADETLRAVHSQVVMWYERLGYSYLEIVRGSSGLPSIIRSVDRPDTVKVCPFDEGVVPVSYPLTRGKNVTSVTEYKRFRVFVQEVQGSYVYFKEFGDPRILDSRTGDFFVEGGPAVPSEYRATELIMFKQAGSDHVYGSPRWLPQVPAILGSREAAEVNLRYFKDNTVPPMILSVTGGRLTEQSYRELRDLLENDRVGTDRQNRILLLEAIAESQSLDEKGSPVGLQVDKLADVRPSDGLFGGYDSANQTKERSAFRLPPVAIGLSQDVNFATANVSTFVLETQVFTPLREVFDEVYNKKLVHGRNGLGLKTVKLRSRSPTVTNPEVVIRSLTALNVMGGVTPRLARALANQLLKVDLPPYPEKDEDDYEEWMDSPIALSLRSSGVGSGSDPATVGNTHDEQGMKDSSTKAVEADGNVSPKEPENGSE